MHYGSYSQGEGMWVLIAGYKLFLSKYDPTFDGNTLVNLSESWLNFLDFTV